MTASHPDADTLLAWWLRETDPAATDALDEHLMACDACGEALDRLVALGEGVRAAFRAGLVGAVTTAPFIDRLEEQGMRVRRYRLPHDGRVNCTVAREDELLAAHLEVPSLEGVERLDVIIERSFEPGVEHRVEDVPFDAAAREVLYLPGLAGVRAAPAYVQVTRLVAVVGGVTRDLGRYEFHHRPWEETRGS